MLSCDGGLKADENWMNAETHKISDRRIKLPKIDKQLPVAIYNPQSLDQNKAYILSGRLCSSSNVLYSRPRLAFHCTLAARTRGISISNIRRRDFQRLVRNTTGLVIADRNDRYNRPVMFQLAWEKKCRRGRPTTD